MSKQFVFGVIWVNYIKRNPPNFKRIIKVNSKENDVESEKSCWLFLHHPNPRLKLSDWFPQRILWDERWLSVKHEDWDKTHQECWLIPNTDWGRVQRTALLNTSGERRPVGSEVPTDGVILVSQGRLRYLPCPMAVTRHFTGRGKHDASTCLSCLARVWYLARGASN